MEWNWEKVCLTDKKEYIVEKIIDIMAKNQIMDKIYLKNIFLLLQITLFMIYDYSVGSEALAEIIENKR